ncbi:MAG: DUF4383 domain-containing protein [Anaerolineae bacterium]|nr:DUF4383 domain-containing protein [Anaerolineae bacterium]
MNLTQISQLGFIRKLALAYAVMFVFVVALGYIPGFTDEAGQLFGLFRIELHDDILHLASGIWAATAAWLSTRASILYFKLFGVLYGLDGVVGLLTGHGYLDGGIFLHPNVPVDLFTRVFANLPHILIGGIAIEIGYLISRRFVNEP